ncbi:hypothetical protein RCL1_001370 [Eukaryota sp. TZLM3-RCL]
MESSGVPPYYSDSDLLHHSRSVLHQCQLAQDTLNSHSTIEGLEAFLHAEVGLADSVLAIQHSMRVFSTPLSSLHDSSSKELQSALQLVSDHRSFLQLNSSFPLICKIGKDFEVSLSSCLTNLSFFIAEYLSTSFQFKTCSIIVHNYTIVSQLISLLQLHDAKLITPMVDQFHAIFDHFSKFLLKVTRSDDDVISLYVDREFVSNSISDFNPESSLNAFQLFFETIFGFTIPFDTSLDYSLHTLISSSFSLAKLCLKRDFGSFLITTGLKSPMLTFGLVVEYGNLLNDSSDFGSIISHLLVIFDLDSNYYDLPDLKSSEVKITPFILWFSILDYFVSLIELKFTACINSSLFPGLVQLHFDYCQLIVERTVSSIISLSKTLVNESSNIKLFPLHILASDFYGKIRQRFLSKIETMPISPSMDKRDAMSRFLDACFLK